MTKVTTRLKNCIRRLFVYNYQLETTHKTLGFCLTGFFPYSNVAMVKAWSSKGLLLETSVPDFLVYNNNNDRLTAFDPGQPG